MAGLVTFLTMAYIIILQPIVLSGVFTTEGKDQYFGAVMVATCLSAALATAIMALYARYPIVQAPGMGENFFFVASSSYMKRILECSKAIVMFSGTSLRSNTLAINAES